MTASAAHLVRHGEVDNPHHVVYADLPGYRLSPLGIAQADATAEHLGAEPVRAVVSSPLQRARQTAAAIARRHDLEVVLDDRLTEWRLSLRWSGVRWEDVDELFSGELQAYLEHPHDLGFAAETLDQCARRVAAVVTEWADRLATGHVVVVGHQDPIHAARAALTASPLDPSLEAKPTHGSVTTLTPVDGHWRRRAYWEPPQGAGFPPGS